MSDWTPLKRVQTALSHQEPDRVPFFLLLTTHGARALGMGVKAYFQRPDLMARAQVAMQRRYGHDCLNGSAYASAELEAFGGETVFFEDGPPNGGPPVITSPAAIDRLVPPRIQDCPVLLRTLDFQARMREAAGPDVPIVGSVIAPFSLPILQMGFEPYLCLMVEDPARFRRLMAVNEEFCVAWANAQLQAGATAIGCADPMGSSTLVTLEQYLALDRELARRTLARIQGPVATHFASGRVLPHLDAVVETGTVAVGVSVLEDLARLKAAARGRLSLLGNLNGIEMVGWTAATAEARVKEALAKAGPGGGFILADNHGEIPWQVPEAVLDAVGDAVRRWGRYPLDWARAGLP